MSKKHKSLDRVAKDLRAERKNFERVAREFRHDSASSSKESNRTLLVVAAIGTVGVIAAAVIDKFPEIAPSDPPAAPEYICSESYNRAIEMYTQDGVWMMLPEESEEEAYCDVNGRMIDAFDLPPGETVYLNPAP
ncbi:hypothetical protein AB0300_05625 [Microbacterium sp. NPDC078814]|uniref:hypothetical protein n=1 Tax=Microbacterium sp. NPDC078814 TaxID=3154767 RepID=UPI00344D138D